MSEHEVIIGADGEPRVWVRLLGGGSVPAIPIRLSWLQRWACDHRWTPHVVFGRSRWVPSDVFDCWRCGAAVRAQRPVDGLWRVRAWIAGRAAVGRWLRRWRCHPKPNRDGE